MADIKFSQFANTPTPNANAYFVGYNSTTGINSRTTLTDLIAAIGAPSGSGTANYVSKWSDGTTLTDSLFYSDGNIAKSIKNDGYSQGLYLNLDNQYFALGYTETGDWENEVIVGFVASSSIFTMGDTGFNQGTHLLVDDNNQIIKTQNQGTDKGLFLDFAANQFSFGDYDGAINGTTLTVNDTAQIINLFSQRVQYTGQDSATIAAFTGNTAGQVAYDSDLNSFQYYNGTAWAAVAPKTTYMMTGVFTNMFGGDPGGLNKDILDWVGSSPASSHSSVLPILQNCRITAAGFKWISSAPIGTISAGDSWTIQVFKMINPLTASTTADGNFTLVGNLNITLTSANSGTTPGVFSSGLDLILNAGDIIRIAGVETGVIGTSTEEAQLTVLFELI
jgi:hypothetical protein